MKQRPYTIKCTNCGREWHYEQFTCYMQKINAFHCNCGGRLIVIHNEPEEEGDPKDQTPAGEGTPEAVRQQT